MANDADARSRAAFCEHARDTVTGSDLTTISAFWKRVHELASKGAGPWKRVLAPDRPPCRDVQPPSENALSDLRDPAQLECLRCQGKLREVEGGRRNSLRRGKASIEANDKDKRLGCAACAATQPTLAVHVGYLQLFCGACDDVVYEPEYDAARCHALLTANPHDNLATALLPGVGLRGMCNLGNTCYMNSVLQVLAQQPLIRDALLASHHMSGCVTARAVRNDALIARDAQQRLARVIEIAEAQAIKDRNALLEAEAAEGSAVGAGDSTKPKRKRKRAEAAVINRWSQERDSSFLCRYNCTWQRPWSSAVVEKPAPGETGRPSSPATLAGRRTPGTPTTGDEDNNDAATNVGDDPDDPDFGPDDELIASNDVGDDKASSDALEGSKSGCIACELEILVKDLHCGSGARRPLVLNHFLYSTWQHSPLLSGYMQQDAHEFFSFVVNKVHAPNEGRACTPAHEVLEAMPAEDPAEPCSCIMHQAFGGMLCSQIKCSGCGAVSESLEPFFDISLDCPSGLRDKDATSHAWPGAPQATAAGERKSAAKEGPENGSAEDPPSRLLARSSSIHAPAISLESLLFHFLATELLTAAIQCGKCSEKRPECSKRLRFRSLPQILCLHIKRFKAGSNLAETVKSDQPVTFPLRGLDLSPFLFRAEGESSDPLHYDLCAVIQHMGNMDSGHYICFVLHHGNWYVCDDERVQRVAELEVLHAQAYMLFYRKRA